MGDIAFFLMNQKMHIGHFDSHVCRNCKHLDIHPNVVVDNKWNEEMLMPYSTNHFFICVVIKYMLHNCQTSYWTPQIGMTSIHQDSISEQRCTCRVIRRSNETQSSKCTCSSLKQVYVKCELVVGHVFL